MLSLPEDWNYNMQGLATLSRDGIDHGYGNMKTATRCFPSGVARYDKEPIFQNTLLVYSGMYYQIGEEHKEFCAEKTQDEDGAMVITQNPGGTENQGLLSYKLRTASLNITLNVYHSIFSYLEESVQNFSLNQLKNILLSVGLLDIHIVR